MITFVATDKGPVEKVKKSMIARTKTLLENDKFLTDIFDGQEIDIFNEICYITSRCMTGKLPENMANCRALSEHDIMKLAQKPYKSKCASNMEVDQTTQFIQSNFGSNPYFSPIGHMFYNLRHNNDILANLIVEAIIIAYLNVVFTVKDSVPSIFNAYCLLVYHWAIKRYKLTQLKDVLRSSGKKPVMIESSITGFDDCIDILKHIFNKKAYTAILNYFKLIYDEDKYECESYYTLIEDLASAILEKAKKSEYVNRLVEDAVKYINTGEHLSEYFVSLLDKRSIRKYGAVLVSSSVSLVGITTQYHIGSLKMYIYKRLNEGYKLKGCKSEDIINMIMSDAICLNNDLGEYKNKLVREYYCVIYKRYNELKNKTKDLENKNGDLGEKAKDYKRQLKETKHLQSKLERDTKELKEKCHKLEMKVSQTTPKENIDELKRIIEESKKRIDGLLASNCDTSRTLNKKIKEINALTTKISKLEEEYQELLEKYEREKAISIKMSEHRKFSSIPIECFINSIKNRKIALIGGDMMFNRLKEYGLLNIKTYKAGCRSVTYEDISDTELIIAATSYVDHSTFESAVGVAKAHKIPMLMFNNKNADILIYSIFEELNK